MAQADSHRLFADIALKIRQSLAPEDILETAVAEVRHLLQCDRVLIYRFYPDWSGIVAMESVAHPSLSIRSRVIADPCFERSWLTPYREGRVRAAADIHQAGLQDCYRDFLQGFNVRANLVVPILLSDAPEPLWGLLIAHHCTAPYPWDEADCALLKQLSDQLAIALHQAQLLQRQQAELEERRQVEVCLRESEARFRRLAENAQDVIYRYRWAPSPQMEYINPAIAELTGYSPGEFYAAPELLFSLIHPEDLEQFRQQLRSDPKHPEQGPAPRLTLLRLIHRQGHQVWVEQRCTPLLDDAGWPTAIEGIVRELGDRQLAQSPTLAQWPTQHPAQWPSQRSWQPRRWLTGLWKQLREPLSGQALSRWGSIGLMLSVIALAEGLRRTGLPDLGQKLLLFGGLVVAAAEGGQRAGRVATLSLWFYLGLGALLGLGQAWGPVLWLYALGTGLMAQWVGQLKDRSRLASQVLNQVNNTLEQRVQERTVALAQTNQQLHQEIDQRRRAQLAHQAAETELQQLNHVLESRVLERTATLEASERRWRHFIDKVRLVVVGLDRDGTINYANPHFLTLTGYSEAEVLGQNWFEIFVPRHQHQEMQQVFGRFLSEGQPAYHQNVILTRAGEERFFAWNNTLIRDEREASNSDSNSANNSADPPAGHTANHPSSTPDRPPLAQGSLSIGEDITERAAIARMKDEFISVVSHELRTPLTSIHGALELLNSEILSPSSERGRHLLHIAAENSHRLVHLVNDILQLERLESGKLKLERQVLCSRVLTQRAQELMQMLLERSHIELRLTDPGFMLWVDGDRVIQVLTNLIDNAIKFSETGAAIELRVEQAPAKPSAETSAKPSAQGSEMARVCFQIEDQGRGIPEDQLGGIFERFHQVDASDSRRRGGTGLGLAICRSIIHQHGGQIWVHSQLGQGSCFYFTLPAAPPDIGTATDGFAPGSTASLSLEVAPQKRLGESVG